ncbi:MAG: hypothetical protein JWM21_1561 [Acidobacteria bacterium]|nr:hypothetical protein [Acidobacteriota bacterium]
MAQRNGHEAQDLYRLTQLESFTQFYLCIFVRNIFCYDRKKSSRDIRP